jgi:hypothetical protein
MHISVWITNAGLIFALQPCKAKQSPSYYQQQESRFLSPFAGIIVRLKILKTSLAVHSG